MWGSGGGGLRDGRINKGTHETARGQPWPSSTVLGSQPLFEDVSVNFRELRVIP